VWGNAQRSFREKKRLRGKVCGGVALLHQTGITKQEERRILLRALAGARISRRESDTRKGVLEKVEGQLKKKKVGGRGKQEFKKK